MPTSGLRILNIGFGIGMVCNQQHPSIVLSKKMENKTNFRSTHIFKTLTLQNM